jgi:hypothetical protein
MPRMYSATGRSRWPFLIGGLVAVVGLGGGVAFALTHHDAPAATVLSPTPTDAPPSSSAAVDTGGGDDEDGAPPTGCLGGLDRDAAMVLTAQKEAAHTPYGAEELNSVSQAVMADDANPTFRDLAGSYAKVPDITGGVVSAGHPFHLSTTNGVWMIDSNATPDRVTVDIATGYVIDGALSPSKVAAIGMTMV